MHENGGNSLPPSQSNVVPSNPTLKPFDPSKQARIMENLKAAVLLRLANSHAHKALSAVQIAAIERGLSQAFPSFRTPTHPTYASVISSLFQFVIYRVFMLSILINFCGFLFVFAFNYVLEYEFRAR